MTKILAAIALLHVLPAYGIAQQQAVLASLIPAAEVIVVVQISSTDYSRTPSDGPLMAHARVLNAVKGRLKKDQSFEFTETASAGPNYRAGEVRILFIEPAGPNAWRILSNLYAKANFFVERDAVPYLNVNSLTSVLQGLPAPATRQILITREMLK